jgi:teichuronic acid biosynthesis glycosyltransferase TuaC
MTRPIRTLLFSTLYPSEARPIHGIFVETRLRELIKSGQVESRVIAPVPWFPFTGARFGDYGKFAATPRVAQRNGVEVHHPRYFLPPKVGMNLAPYTLAMAALPVARQLIRDGFDFDLIDAHYYYPDGVAAGILAKKLGKPFIVTARGTDLNLIPQYTRPRRLILETAQAAAASIGVCKALMDTLAELGADSAKLHVFRNGVDLERFTPEPRAAARIRLGLPQERRQLLSVGHLIERKGHHLAIEALPLLPEDIELTIIGTGPEQAALKNLASRLQVTQRVRFAGQIPQTELKWWYSAADILLLGSSREGWANVLLESMACGTPVVASNIWGTPEVVSTPDAGLLMQARTAAAMAASINELFAAYPAREKVRQHAEGFSWTQTTEDQLRLFRSML